MATVNRLLREVAGLEHDLKTHIEGDGLMQQSVRAGYTVAQVAAAHCILELSVKGVIPEGKGGRIMAELKTALEASRDRVTQ